MSVQTATLTERAILQLSERLGEPAWLRDKRLAALRAYESLPVPAWDRTSLTGLDLGKVVIPSDESTGGDMPPAMRQAADQQADDASFLFEVDHRPARLQLSDELKQQGVIVCDFQTAIKEHEELLKEYYQSVIGFDEDKLVALHYAAASSGLFVYVPKNVQVSVPIEYRISAVTPGLSLFPHTLIIADRGAEVTVIQGVSGDDQGVSRVISEVVEVVPIEGAQIRFGSIQTWGDETYQFTLRRSMLNRDARVEWLSGDFGGKLVRSHAKSVLVGEGSESTNLSVFFGDGNQHMDIGITMLHEGSHTASDMLTKGVLNDRARVVYRGLTDIENGARFASGFQRENTMLLSKHARSDAIPGLEIDETEVQAGHAATTGQIDPVHLFYLMSRGLRKEEAIHLIVVGFFDPVVSRMPIERVRNEISELINRKMLA